MAILLKSIRVENNEQNLTCLCYCRILVESVFSLHFDSGKKKAVDAFVWTDPALEEMLSVSLLNKPNLDLFF